MRERPPQLDLETVRRMTPDEVVAARKEGLLDDLMSGNAPEPEATKPEPEGARPGGADQGAMGASPPAGTRAWLRWLGPQRIVELRRSGKLNALMRGEHGHK